MQPSFMLTAGVLFLASSPGVSALRLFVHGEDALPPDARDRSARMVDLLDEDEDSALSQVEAAVFHPRCFRDQVVLSELNDNFGFHDVNKNGHLESYELTNLLRSVDLALSMPRETLLGMSAPNQEEGQQHLTEHASHTAASDDAVLTLAKQQATQLITQVDGNGDRKMSKKDLSVRKRSEGMEYLSVMEEHFEEFDHDKDHKLSVDESTELFAKLFSVLKNETLARRAEEVLLYADKNHDRQLSKEEATAFVALPEYDFLTPLVAQFQVFDADDNSVLDIDEISNLLSFLLESLHRE